MPEERLKITPQKKREIEEELTYLRTTRRAEITEAIKRAREYGDLSENFEYAAARRDQAILNGKIADLEAVLDRAVVEEAASGGDTVQVGAFVKVRELENDDEWEYAIVDALSADPANDKISYLSPVGQALMNKKIGDVVNIVVPDGVMRCEIAGLRY